MAGGELLGSPKHLGILKMAGVKGRSGTNKGKDRAFADAIRLVVSEEDESRGKRKLRVLAEKLYEEAAKGEGWAMNMIADRLDGKPAQESTVTIDDKRDATDWTRDELVRVLDDARAGRLGASAQGGSGGGPDSVH